MYKKDRMTIASILGAIKTAPVALYADDGDSSSEGLAEEQIERAGEIRERRSDRREATHERRSDRRQEILERRQERRTDADWENLTDAQKEAAKQDHERRENVHENRSERREAVFNRRKDRWNQYRDCVWRTFIYGRVEALHDRAVKKRAADGNLLLDLGTRGDYASSASPHGVY